MSKSLSTSPKKRKSMKGSRKISRTKKKKKPHNAFGAAAARKIAQKKKIASNKNKNERNKKIKAKRYANTLLLPFDENFLSIMAKASGFLKRKSKLIPVYFIASLVFTYLSGGNRAILLISSNLDEWFSLSISPQAISQRLRDKCTAKFLKQLFLFQLAQKLEPRIATGYAKYLPIFKSIKIGDSSQIELSKHTAKGLKGSHGNASKSSLKLNYLIDLFSLKTARIDLKAGAYSDKNFSKKIKNWLAKGELLIRDLGFFSLETFQKIENLGAFYLSRLQKKVKIYINESDNSPIEIESYFKNAMRKNIKIIDINVFLGDVKLPSRLVVFKAPKWVTKQRLKKYKASHKKNPEEDYVIWAGYSFFVTNIDSKLCGSEAIYELYKIRWQIELMFKSYKSTLKIHVIRGTNKSSVLCIAYAKLIGLLLTERLASFTAEECERQDRELSFDKTVKWLLLGDKIIVAILNEKLFELLLNMPKKLRYMWKDKRTKDQSTCKKVLKVFQDPTQCSFYKEKNKKIA